MLSSTPKASVRDAQEQRVLRGNVSIKFARTFVASAAVAAVMGLGYVGLTGAAPSAAAAGESEIATPAKVDNFRLSDQKLESHELYRMADASAVVILTVQNGCPVCRNTAASLKALQAAYSGKGV